MGDRSDSPTYDLRLEGFDAGHHAEQALRSLLGDRTVSIFHATRLLPHEIEAILTHGLQPLSIDHRGRRLDKVIEIYGSAIGVDRLEELRTTWPLTDRGHREGRLGLSWGVSPLQASFDDADDGLRT